MSSGFQGSRSVIKSVQNVQIAWAPDGGTSATATVNSVDTAKSFLVPRGFINNINATGAATSATLRGGNWGDSTRWALTNATTVTVSNSSANALAYLLTQEATLVEYY